MRNYAATLAVALYIFLPTSSWSQGSAPAPALNTEKFCIQNLADYNTYKNYLPEFLKSIPTYMGAETKVFGFDVIAVLNISFRGEAFVLKSDLWKLRTRYTDEQEISKVCFDRKKKRMEIKFNNREESKVKYTDVGFEMDGVKLSRLSTAMRLRYQERILEKERDKNGDSAPAGSQPSPATSEVQR